MATSHQVTCTIKDGPDNDRRIDAIGGFGWKLGQDQAIAAIERGEYTFYTIFNGAYADVLVRQHPTTWRKYLTTSPDGIRPNNLLWLPNCS